MSSPLPPRCEPKAYEGHWQEAWEGHHLFQAPPIEAKERHTTILLPPPNVTGTLTLGHSLGGTCMDVLARWMRMRGVPTLWLPGVDHAGLATQIAVRKALEKKGVNPVTLTRQELASHIEEWKTEKEAYIRRQLTAHGFSLDWTRYVYTMDPSYRTAVRTAFIDLYRQGLIYRAERMVNWDPKIRTAVSDLEVIPVEVHGKLWYIRYPFEGGEGSGITVATTRPETLFGDVAVAIHPEDERHRDLIGRRVHLPLTDRTIPVIADPAVDRTFGNGALKITPSHDPADLAIVRRHPELPQRRDVLDESAHLSGEYVPEDFRGLNWKEARERVVERLRSLGLVEKEEPHLQHVGHSDRSNVPIEPRLSTQWFVDTKAMGRRALESVQRGEIRIHPEAWTKTYFHFMEHLEDWCISRQIIWGHEIPVWYCDSCHTFDAYVAPPPSCPRCGATALRPDPDVLDTWFSSWLWPFATLGWPEKTRDLASYFPASVLVTGSDIVFFWVARMIMASLTFLNEVPFPEVFLTGILTDRDGRKLSKSLGNSPDPLEFIEAWGADAFRFALLFPNPVEQSGWWDYKRHLEGARNFITKLWNVVRLVQGSLRADTVPASLDPPVAANLFDRWILSRLAYAERSVADGLEHHDLTRAASTLYQFVWHELADWYLEAQKERLKGLHGPEAQQQTQAVALFAVDRVLHLLHPFIPHVTEELWHAIPHTGEYLAVSTWPENPRAADLDAEEKLAVFQEVARGLRTLSHEAGWVPNDRPNAMVSPTTETARALLSSEEHRRLIATLAKVGEIQITAETGTPHPGMASLVLAPAEIYLARREGGDVTGAAMERERKMLEQLLSRSLARLEDATFREKAPAAVRAELEAKVAELRERLERMARHGVAAE